MKNKVLMIKLLFCVITISITAAQAQTNPPARTSTTRTRTSSGYNWLNVESDSAGDPNKRITLHRNGEVYKIRVANEKITEMYIDDKKVPEGDFPKYASLVNEVLAQIKRDEEQAARDREQAERDRKQADKDREQAERDRQQADNDRKQADRDRERADHDRTQADRHREQAERDRSQVTRHREQADADRAQAERDRRQASQDRAQAERDRRQADQDRVQAERDRHQAGRDREQAERDRKQAEEDRKMLEAFLDDLVKENIIQSKEEVRVAQLTDEALIVNDKKQPGDIHQKFKAKYLKSSHSRFTYTNEKGRRGISIDRNK